MEEAISRAEIIWDRIRSGNPEFGTPMLGEGHADILHALLRIMSARTEVSPIPGLAELTTAYGLVERCHWPENDWLDRSTLLTGFSFLIWNHFRRCGPYPEMKLWEKKCIAHACSEESVRDFLALRGGSRSYSLSVRFFENPAVLLAACVDLEERRNRSPVVVAAEASLLCKWLLGGGVLRDAAEVRSYFAGECAISAAVANRHLGRFVESERWLQHAESKFRETKNPAPCLAKAKLIRLTLLHDSHRESEVLKSAPSLAEELARLGMRWELAVAKLTEAHALKICGKHREAFALSRQLLLNSEVKENPLLFIFASMAVIELEAILEGPLTALQRLREVMPLVEEAGSPVALGSLQAILGQVLRDEGRLGEAIDAYRAAITTYAAAGMAFAAAYIRVIVAEVLLSVRRGRDAIVEILAALPVIEREGVVPDAVAAVTLLRKSLRQAVADPRALRELREHLDRLKDGRGL